VSVFCTSNDYHKVMIALHYIHYNFARIHKTPRVPGDGSGRVGSRAEKLARFGGVIR
jgi:hypothetical protein